MLALGRHPLQTDHALVIEQWVLLPDPERLRDGGWLPAWRYREAPPEAVLIADGGEPLARWTKPGRIRRPIGRRDQLQVGGRLLQPALVPDPGSGWGTAITGIRLVDDRGTVGTIGGDRPLWQVAEQRLEATFRTRPDPVLLAMTVAMLASIWDGERAGRAG